MIPHAPTVLIVEFGTSPGSLGSQTAAVIGDSTTPAQLLLSGLTPDTPYYYRLRFRPPASVIWQFGSGAPLRDVAARADKMRDCASRRTST